MCRNRAELSNYVSKLILLAFSIWIIYTFDWRFCLCILLTGAITFGAGLWIEKEEDDRKRRHITTATVVILVAFLGISKYLNFFMESVYKLVGANWHALKLLMPIGISFYTFSAIGYVIDVRNRRIQAERNFFDFIFFMSFFPKLVSGPIANARDFLPQLKENKRITAKGAEEGIQIFAIGLFKKVVIADHLALFVDSVFWGYQVYSTPTVWLAVFSYFVQLYFDFSGYSDMAIGISEIFGYKLPRNFNLPFVARNITEFWNRWHMTLTMWLNEYVFNPVAMSLRRKTSHLPKEKKKKARSAMTYLAIFITFAVSGIWHGAGMTFVVWGLFHAIWSVVHAMYSTWMKKNHLDYVNNKPAWIQILDILVTFVLLNLAEVVFRASSMEHAFGIFKAMFVYHDGVTQWYTWTFFAYAVMIGSELLAWYHMKKNNLKQVESYYPMLNLRTVGGMTVFITFCGLITIIGYFGGSYFIYGNF